MQAYSRIEALRTEAPADRFRVALAVTLRAGVMLAAGLLLAGVARYAELATSLPADSRLQETVASFAFLEDLRKGDALAVCTLGTLVLVLLPIARVALSLAYFIGQRDRLYTALTGVVLLLLLTGGLLGKIV